MQIVFTIIPNTIKHDEYIINVLLLESIDLPVKDYNPL